MWHLCRQSSRPLIRVGQMWIRHPPIVPSPSLSQRLISFPSFFKYKKAGPEPLPQPPVNPRHPPDYIPPKKTTNPYPSATPQSQSSIFARFRHAYAKYGKILLAVHFVSSFAWCTGLILLHFKGFDLGKKIRDERRSTETHGLF